MTPGPSITSLPFHVRLEPLLIPGLLLQIASQHFRKLSTSLNFSMWQSYRNSNKFIFLPSIRLLITILIFLGTGYYVWSKFSKNFSTGVNVQNIYKVYLLNLPILITCSEKTKWSLQYSFLYCTFDFLSLGCRNQPRRSFCPIFFSCFLLYPDAHCWT